MKALPSLLAAVLALCPATGVAQDAEPPQRRGQLFMLSVRGGSDADINYAAYHANASDPGSLVVQRSLAARPDSSRAEVSAATCPGLRAAVESLERTPWPAISLSDEPRLPYLERGQFTAYTFYGALAYAHATSWEARLFALDLPGQPRGAFVTWADMLVRTVDTCLANRG